MVVKIETEEKIYRGEYALDIGRRKLKGTVYVTARSAETAKTEVHNHIREGFSNLAQDIIRIWGMPKFGALPLDEAYAKNSIGEINVEEIEMQDFKISLEKVISNGEGE